VNAWIGTDQVINGYEVSNVQTGWAVIGSSVQSNYIYTYAQFDNFQVVGERVQCQTPDEGTQLILMNCGGLNSANSQWLFQDGFLKLMSNPTLCVTGAENAEISTTLTLSPCQEGNSNQIFEYINSTQYPFSKIFQGSGIVGLSGNNVVVAPEVKPGSAVGVCESYNRAQNITFTGSTTTPGQIMFGSSCLSGACNNSQGCYPLQFIPCNDQDTSQQFNLTTSGSFVIHQNSKCLDIDGRTGPAVGAYWCNGGPNQQWTIGHNFIEAVEPADQCLTSGLPDYGAQVVLNEFGNGEITVFGDFVTDQCFGACTVI
jgi:hypothetical protein